MKEILFALFYLGLIVFASIVLIWLMSSCNEMPGSREVEACAKACNGHMATANSHEGCVCNTKPVPDAGTTKDPE